MHMDPDFNCLDKLIAGTELNTKAARYHVPQIERQIQVVEERMLAVHGGLQYERMTSRMIIELGKYVVMVITTLPSKRGLPQTYSPSTIMTSKQLDFKKQFWTPFGAYAQTHDNRTVTNLMVDRNQGAVCLGPTGNLKGSYEFLLEDYPEPIQINDRTTTCH